MEILPSSTVVRQVQKLLEQEYFSESNFRRDKFLRKEAHNGLGFISIETLLSFKKLASLTTEPDVVATAVKCSKVLILSADRLSVKVAETKSEKAQLHVAEHRAVKINYFGSTRRIIVHIPPRVLKLRQKLHFLQDNDVLFYVDEALNQRLVQTDADLEQAFICADSCGKVLKLQLERPALQSTNNVVIAQPHSQVPHAQLKQMQKKSQPSLEKSTKEKMSAFDSLLSSAKSNFTLQQQLVNQKIAWEGQEIQQMLAAASNRQYQDDNVEQQRAQIQVQQENQRRQFARQEAQQDKHETTQLENLAHQYKRQMEQTRATYASAHGTGSTKVQENQLRDQWDDHQKQISRKLRQHARLQLTWFKHERIRIQEENRQYLAKQKLSCSQQRYLLKSCNFLEETIGKLSLRDDDTSAFAWQLHDCTEQTKRLQRDETADLQHLHADQMKKLCRTLGRHKTELASIATKSTASAQRFKVLSELHKEELSDILQSFRDDEASIFERFTKLRRVKNVGTAEQ